MSDIENYQTNKSHRRKFKSLKKLSNKDESYDDDFNKKDDSFIKAKLRNPRAFALQNYVAAERNFRRTQDIKAKRLNLPEVDRSPLEPPPIFVAIVGPPKVGKSTLMRNLVKNYTRQKLNNINGPVTVVTSKNRRITFYECNNDLNSMIDTAKVADLVLLLIDSSFGFEMETFEFLNICQVHGFPRIIGILTHMDLIRNQKALKKTKKKLKYRFWTEIYQGAKLFYLTSLVNGDYKKNEIHNLARFISVMKFRDNIFRSNHSYIVADRIEDLSQPDLIRKNETCDRNVCFYGYVRGSLMKKNSNIHIPGCGDFEINDITYLPDPCPLPDKEKKRTLDDRERLMYAPFSGVGGIVYDKDAVYIELGGSHSHSVKTNEIANKNPLINNIITSKNAIDTKLTASFLQVFSGDNIKNGEKKQFYKKQDLEKVTEKENLDSSSEYSSDSQGSYEYDKDYNSNVDLYNINDFVDKNHSKNYESTTWKTNLKLKTSFSLLKNKTTNWSKIIYYDKNINFNNSNKAFSFENGDNSDNIFQLKKINTKDFSNFTDNSKYETKINNWYEHEKSNQLNTYDSIKDCFLTGIWEKNSDAKYILNLEKDEKDNITGDYEDLDNCDLYEANSSIEEEKSITKNLKNKTKLKSEMSKRERLIEKKIRLKEQFDRDFDESKSLNKTGESAYYDNLKEETNFQSTLNKLEFQNLNDTERVEYEGFRPGMYVRIEIKQIPYELIKNFDPRFLIIIGCTDSNESNIGFVQARLKKHRWYNKILKANDPLIISLGWRRFQTIPIYFIQDHNMRNRSLKYTPQHMYCQASFWGPISSQGSGFLALQTISNQNKNFRIAATGVIIEANKSTQIVKKLKLIGTPYKIFRKTAFIEGMFSTVLEASKFEGSKIKTVSGIRGQIKKVLHSSIVPPGTVRATFEDKIMPSDSIFLRAWFTVNVPKFYIPITNMLNENHAEWVGLKTLGMLKKEKNIKTFPNQNSLYKDIAREEKIFIPLKINRHLEEKLPFNFKTKDTLMIDTIEKQRIAVLKEPDEEKSMANMKMLKKVYENRIKNKMETQLEIIKKYKNGKKKAELKRLQKSKEFKKQIYRRLGKQEKRKANRDE